ncbi:archaellum component FlaC [Citrobacter amalonaticus]|uniref:hypothetical protein n=1 Tax=Citrobacter amalonaticus TaxID=35703 RepID=UPI0020A030DF|nr:hypothetical protein [Citrobacter amalonaticus]MCP1629655.1 archaellum component FlaC [Citrobacter amalonaticus]
MGLYTDITIINNIKETNVAINNDLIRLEKISKSSSDTRRKNHALLYRTLNNAWSSFTAIINNNPQHLDANTRFNQENFATLIEFKLSDYKSNRIVFLSNLLRLLYEYYFWTGTLSTLNNNHITNKTLTSLDNAFADDNPNVDFSWIRDKLPIALMKWLLNSDDFISARNFISELDSSKGKVLNEISENSTLAIHHIKKSSEASLQMISDNYDSIKKTIIDGKQEAESNLDYVKESIIEIKALEERVKNLKSEYNFVGLSNGFDRIKNKKEKELSSTEMNYKNLFGTIFIAPVIAVILHFCFPNLYPKDYSTIFIILPFLTIEMAIIYFFRLSYLEAKALRTQLMQIELRLSLCAFIDGYVEYRRKNNIDIENVLDSFDALIFSPIQTNENNIPAMFDGLEAIAGVAEKVMKKGS